MTAIDKSIKSIVQKLKHHGMHTQCCKLWKHTTVMEAMHLGMTTQTDCFTGRS